MKTSKTPLLAALGLAIFVAALVPSVGKARGLGFAFGFGNRVAGSYLGQVDGEFDAFPALFSFHPDRTAILSDAGGGASVGLGSWKRTGDRQIKGTFMQFLFFDGVLARMAVFTHDTTFSEDFKSFETDGFAEIFECSFDSGTGFECDTDSDPVDAFPFTVTAQRIPAVQNN